MDSDCEIQEISFELLLPLLIEVNSDSVSWVDYGKNYESVDTEK